MNRNDKGEWIFIAALVLAIVWMVGSIWFGAPRIITYLGLGAVVCSYWSIRQRTSYSAYIAYKKGKFEKSIELCELQASKFPSDPYPISLAAYAAFCLKDWGRCVRYSTQGISRGGDLRTLLVIRSQANLYLHKFEHCKSDATDAINLGRVGYTPYVLRADALISLYQYDDALKDIDSQIMLESKPQVASILRAAVLSSKNQHDAALMELSTVFEEITPDLLSMALMLRAYIHCCLGKLERAIEDIDSTIELEPDWQAAHINRGYYFGRTGQLDLAFESLKEAETKELELRSGYIESNRARLFLLLGQNERALECSSLAFGLGPERASILSTYGLMLLRNNLIEDAKKHISKAIELDPFEAEAYWFRGELHEKLGDEEKEKQDRKVATDYGYIPYL